MAFAGSSTDPSSILELSLYSGSALLVWFRGLYIHSYVTLPNVDTLRSTSPDPRSLGRRRRRVLGWGGGLVVSGFGFRGLGFRLSGF